MKTSADFDEKRSTITFQGSQGTAYRASPIRVTRYLVIFELHLPDDGLRVSEVLQNLKIVFAGRTVYSGRATVKSLIKTGMAEVCEASLEDTWFDLDPDMAPEPGRLRLEYGQFTQEWGKFYRIFPEYKTLVADIHTYLTHLRLWADQLDLNLKFPGERQQEIDRELGPEVVSTMNALFEKYEFIMDAVPDELRPVHRMYLQRQIHPLVLCSPFAHRTYTKPLGYAGDYEMVNMLIRHPFEGKTLFARLLNSWFIAQPPAEAHRNRLKYLTQRLMDETVRVAVENRPARIFSLGCGPAAEVQKFLEHDLSDRADFVMVDFNEETLSYTTGVLEKIKARHGRTTALHAMKRSVSQIIKAAGKQTATSQTFDYVYCAGLFDYLPDPVCKQLMNIFYEMVAPGGLLVVTNVDPCNPIRHMLDNLLEWHLIYRGEKKLRSLAPDILLPQELRVITDYTGVNVFMEIRKPGP